MEKKKPTKEEQEKLLVEIMERDQELGLYDDEEIYKMPDNKWDFYSGLPNPSSYIDDGQGDDWDEDHALDMVMNDMVNGLDLEDILNESEMAEYNKLQEEKIKNIEVIEHEVVVPSDKFELLDKTRDSDGEFIFWDEMWNKSYKNGK